MSLISNRNKILSEFQKTSNLQKQLFDLAKFDYKRVVINYFNKISVVDLAVTPTYYDLYNYNGIFSAVSLESPTPVSAYEKTAIAGSDYYSYSFIYPLYGFAVPAGETPESYTDNATPWIYKTTVAITKKLINFPILPDWALDNFKLICYVCAEDGSPIGDLTFILLAGGTNIQTISVDFNYFYRWIKLDVGYNFEFYCIYPMATGRNLSLFTKLYFYNMRSINNESFFNI